MSASFVKPASEYPSTQTCDKDLGVVGAEPAFNSSVDPAEIGREGDVAATELVGGEARERAVEAGLDLAAGEEHGGGFAVVGAAAVVVDPVPEFAECHRGHAIELAELLEVVDERGEAVGQLVEQGGVGLQLVGVGVEAAELHVIDSRRHAGGDQLGDQLEVAGQAGLRVSGLVLDRRTGLADLVGVDAGIEAVRLQESFRLGGGRGVAAAMTDAGSSPFASCRTVVPSEVDRLKSSLRASSCSIAVTTPPPGHHRRCSAVPGHPSRGCAAGPGPGAPSGPGREPRGSWPGLTLPDRICWQPMARLSPIPTQLNGRTKVYARPY